MIILLSILMSFLIGSIPTGYLITKKFFHIDIRKVGSGNIGSTNVKRAAGGKASLLTQVFDILKGIVPIALGILLSQTSEIPISRDTYLSILAIAVILGHDYTPFLSFNGGKGANTTLGAFLLIAPIPSLVGAAIHTVLKFLIPVVSVRSMVFGTVIPIACIVMGYPMPVVISSAIAAVIMIYRHKDNLKRIVKGEEK